MLVIANMEKSLMAEWLLPLEQVSQRHKMYCHDNSLEVMSSNLSGVKLGVLGTSVKVTDGSVVRAGVSVTRNVLS